MIAKRIPRRAGTSSTARLVRYMVAAQGGIEPDTWKRTADYILDNRNTTTQGEKVASYRVTNCGTDDPGDATALIQATQAKNTRSKTDKTYHLVYSFPPGEQPPIEVLHAIEDELCAAIGYADHQRVSAVHNDTDHLHVHVAINKVHPTRLNNVEPYYDKARLMEASERLEIKYGLQRTNHGIEEKRNAQTIRLGPDQQRDTRFRAYLRKSYDLSFGEPPEAKTLNGLRKLSGSRMAGPALRATVLLPGHARPGVGQGGGEPTNSVRWPGDGVGENARGAGGQRVGGKAGDMEAHAGVETLTGYVARELAPELRQANTWQEIHQAAEAHGLVVKLRGAGLVIGDPGLDLWTKASSCARDLSLKSLTGRVGPFEPPAGLSQQATGAKPSQEPPEGARGARKGKGEGYKPSPLHQGSTADLFAQYQRERAAAQEARAAAREKFAAEQKKYGEELAAWHKEQRAALRRSTHLGRGEKKAAYQKLAEQRREDWAAKRAATDAGRKAASSASPLPTWQAFLEGAAAKGDLTALAALRSRQGRQARLAFDLLTAEDAASARHVVFHELQPRMKRNGEQVYNVRDGGQVTDRKADVRVDQLTAGAAFLALSLAGDRFEGRDLVVQGSAEFKDQVVWLAGTRQLAVTFSDPAMEAERARLAAIRQKEDQQSPAQTTDALQAFVASRNAQRDKISSITYHRPWTPADAGPVEYQGRRKLSDGAEVVLLKRGEEMLVKPVTTAQAAKASTWKVGQQITTDNRGRFVTDSQGVKR